MTATTQASPSPTPTVTSTATPYVATDVFDDFEYGLNFGPGWCCPPAGCWGFPVQLVHPVEHGLRRQRDHSWMIQNIRNNNAVTAGAPGPRWTAA